MECQKSLNKEQTPQIATNLEVIAKGLPGWGAAFRDLRQLSSLSQAAVATALGLNPTAVSHWEREKHRPAPAVLRKALIAMRVDVRLLEQYFPGTIAGGNALDVNTNVKSAAFNVQELIHSMGDADPDELERALHEKFDATIIAAQAAKALAGDTKAAGFLLSR